MSRIITRKTMCGLVALWIGVTGCDSKWSAPHKMPGPMPLGPPGTPIVRMQRERPTFEVTHTEIFWDDGRGPIKARDRVTTITNAAPQDLLDRLTKTREALDVNGHPYGRHVCDARAVVVSLNPDVLIVSVADETPKENGQFHDVFDEWDRTEGRWQIVEKALDRGVFGYWLGDYWTYAGPLVPWADEMYAFSTDPGVPYQRVKFENDQATVSLPTGKLVLRRRGIDVDVSRE